MTARHAGEHRVLDALFYLLLLVMAGHESEHVAQVLQKDVFLQPCPAQCRGLLGFIFDVEPVHFAYNAGIFVLLAVVFCGYRVWESEWRRTHALWWWTFTLGVFAFQGYHVVEHTVKLVQWGENGHRAPTPGLLGQLLPPAKGRNFSLIELHFAINTLVFVCIVAGYFGLRFHKRRKLEGRAMLKASVALALTAAIALAVVDGVARATAPPVVHLAAGIHRGPLVITRTEKLVGARGTIVRGGIVVKANLATVENVTVTDAENGIVVDGAKWVTLDNVHISRVALDGIHVRRSTVTIRNCTIESGSNPYAQGIDISFSYDLPPSTVHGCRITGGREGIVTHWAQVMLDHNEVSETSLRAIAVTEMSMGMVEHNDVRGSLGVGIMCGDHSMCTIERNAVADTRPDRSSGDETRAGIGILAHYGADAEVAKNSVSGSPGGVAAFFGARLKHPG